jgi:alkylation response protein AidB-like acyl-CoA dehydrogenase
MEVPEGFRIGAEGEGYRIALSTLESGRIGIAAQSIGMARAALDYAVAYARDRVAFGKPILDHQAVGFRLVDARTKLEAARQLTLHAARRRAAGLPALEAACMAKLFASEAAEAICTAAIQTLGGYGYLSDYPVERIYRDVRVCQIYEGTSDVQKIILQRML